MTTYQLDDLYRLTGNNPKAVLRLLQIFVKDTPNQVNKLKLAAENQDLNLVGETLHKLIPKARHLGLVPVANKMRAMKEQIDTNASVPTAELHDIVHVFDGLLEHIHKDIHQLQQQ